MKQATTKSEPAGERLANTLFPGVEQDSGACGVSVIIALGHDAANIRQCANGILYQQLDVPIEIIVVRKADSDEAFEILQDIMQDKHSLTVVDDPTEIASYEGGYDQKQGGWLYAGLAAVTQPYVITLSARAWWNSPYLLTDHLSVLEARREVAASAAPCLEHNVVACAFNERPVSKHFAARTLGPHEVLEDYCLGTLSGVLFRTAHLKQIDRSFYMLPSFERFLSAAVMRSGILASIPDVSVVERVDTTLDNLPHERRLVLHQTNMTSLFSALTEFDAMTEKALNVTVRRMQSSILRELQASVG